MRRLDIEVADMFVSLDHLMKKMVSERSGNQLSLNGNLEKADALFEQLRVQAGAIDQTLTQYVMAIRTRALRNLQELEKKMIRAEKRKFSDLQNALVKIREELFPGNKLQERVENFSHFYAKWGKDFIDSLLQHSSPLNQEFVVLSE